MLLYYLTLVYHYIISLNYITLLYINLLCIITIHYYIILYILLYYINIIYIILYKYIVSYYIIINYYIIWCIIIFYYYILYIILYCTLLHIVNTAIIKLQQLRKIVLNGLKNFKNTQAYYTQKVLLNFPLNNSSQTDKICLLIQGTCHSELSPQVLTKILRTKQCLLM